MDDGLNQMEMYKTKTASNEMKGWQKVRTGMSGHVHQYTQSHGKEGRKE